MDDLESFCSSLLYLQKTLDKLDLSVEASLNHLQANQDAGINLNMCPQYQEVLDKENKEAFFSRILLQISVDPDPRAFVVSRVLLKVIAYAVCKRLDTSPIENFLQKTLSLIISSIKTEEDNVDILNQNEHVNEDTKTNELEPFKRNKYWLFFRVLEEFLVNEDIELRRKKLIKAQIRSCIRKDESISIWINIFPFRIMKWCCHDFSAADWVNLVDRLEANKNICFFPLHTTYDIASIFRDIDLTSGEHKRVALLCIKIIRMFSIHACPSDSMDVQWSNIQSAWIQTLLFVLRKTIEVECTWTDIVTEQLMKLQSTKNSQSHEATMLDLIESSDECLFRSLVDLAWIMFKLNSDHNYSAFQEFNTAGLFGVLMHKFDYSKEFFVEIMLSSEASLDAVEYFLFILKLALFDKSQFVKDLKTIDDEVEISAIVQFFKEFSLSLKSPQFIFNVEPLLNWMSQFVAVEWSNIKYQCCNVIVYKH